MRQIKPIQSLTLLLNEISVKNITTEEIIHHYYDQIESKETTTQAWEILRSRDEYLAEYHRHQEFYDQSILKGLPFGVKDVIDTKEFSTAMGSAIHQGRQPLNDANCVITFKKAGGIVMGKTVTTEFAFFKPGKTVNPHNIEATPGGSSSGSAAAVASNMCSFALGTQTAASIIRPASYCGVVGYVGTINQFSSRGVQPLAQSFDSLGILTNDIEDLPLLRNIQLMRKHENINNEINQNEAINVILCDGLIIGDIELEMQNALKKLTEILPSHSINIIPFTFGQELKKLVYSHELVMAYEVSRNLLQESEQKSLLSSQFQDLIKYGMSIAYNQYIEECQYIQSQKQYFHQALQSRNADMVIAPSASGVAPNTLSSTGLPFMSRPWQALGLPTISLPLYNSDKNMPLGIQFIGQQFQDDKLIRQVSKINNIVNSFSEI